MNLYILQQSFYPVGDTIALAQYLLNTNICGIIFLIALPEYGSNTTW